MSDPQFTIEWLDAGQEPKVAPNSAYPAGIDLDASHGNPRCRVTLPYPAKRIGSYVVTCHQCGLRAACTTAGRPDDPRSLTVSCKKEE